MEFKVIPALRKKEAKMAIELALMAEANNSATERALSILGAIASAEAPTSISDLSTQLALPKTTVHRLTLLLEHRGLVQREPGTRRFVGGPSLAELALNALANSWRAERHAVLDSLVKIVRETCNITVLDGHEVVYIDRVESHWPLRVQMRAGTRVPLHCGASGKVFLGFMAGYKRKRMLSAAPLKRYTERTQTSVALLQRELKRVKRAGAAIDNQEFMEGLVGLAVPVFDHRARVCATVSMHVPVMRVDAEHVVRYIPELTRAATAISRTLDPRLSEIAVGEIRGSL